ncbi:UDP-N-acetylmuramoyl-L-alanyl-D-glutamate--2,6-diaminopimelate ligase [Longimicrobium sp.]|uniref:UDP-N-acetylmuramoyl-L-alanyl-D-glutamate--2, 6-diaminopimelate ligase n=1 Tax=Longimicrobium sp. TaxID=2029185 RepID=UPI002E3741C4|nr:UDP-N-acetylmuramoyl-L-alanyl-D-glutamate--2,6-diaminopimelate ligase [Longimicrobium sp.]HEX6037107.1 UDP-N-acetylmuramoyl-L-alanyl-D-glutamate--2,6-diaminopimelate ligase [Longimicrobium sp.]
MTNRRTTLGALEARLAREDLLAGDGRLSAGHATREVWDVTADSRQVRVGAVFCAWRGTSADSHQYLSAVSELGAAGIVAEACDDAVPTPQVCVSDGRLGAAFAAAEFFGDPWAEMTLVGVTGTNGKTTTAAMLRHLLGLDGGAGYIGTLGAIGADGEVIPGTEGLTTPGPVEAARWLRRFLDEGVSRVAMEVSSHALDQARMAAARFDAAVFTNLTRDHLDYHGTMEAYREAKLRLLALLKPNGAAVMNCDDPEWRDVTSPVGRTIRFGVAHPEQADVAAEDMRVGPGGMEFTLRTPDGSEPVALPIFGDFNVSNAVASAAVLWSLGWTPGRIAEALGALPQVPGRLERISGPPASATVLRDYAHTPDALERALLAVRPLVKGRLIVVFGAGGDRDTGKRPEMGAIAARLADLAIVTSDNPRTEDPERILDDIERGMEDAPRLRLSDRREAIRTALTEGRPDDLVLLAGKGHETYQIVGTEKRPFDERAIVQELLAEMHSAAGGDV